MSLKSELEACTLCQERFANTYTAHKPRPVIWFEQGAKILIAGQAPGMRVHKSGKPFDDPSGDRLRAWLGVDKDLFYDRSQIAILPMAFCFPGYNEKGADLPPPAICAKEWRSKILDALGTIPLVILVGGYAQKYHLQNAAKSGVTKTVANWRDFAPSILPLPHPSWRNTAWLKRNTWFEAELLPVLKLRVKEVLAI